MSELTKQLVDSVRSLEIAALLEAHLDARVGRLPTPAAQAGRQFQCREIAERAIRRTDPQRVQAAHHQAGRRGYEIEVAAGVRRHTDADPASPWGRVAAQPLAWGGLTPRQQGLYIVRAARVVGAFESALRGVEQRDRDQLLAALAAPPEKESPR